MEDYRAILEQLETKIREGRHHRLHHDFASLNFTKIPFELRTRFARLANRAGFPVMALRIIGDIFDRDRPPAEMPPPAQQAEYALALSRIGASREALSILKMVDPSDCAEVLLYQSLAHFSEWDYAPTINLLERYIKSDSLSGYQRLVGKINLAAAYVIEQEYEKGRKLLEELLKITETQNHHLLYSNALEISAQLAINQEDYSAAAHHLENARRAVMSSKERSQIYVAKWQTILGLYQTPKKKELLDSLVTIKQEAQERQIWETVRECDYYQALFTENQDLFLHVYFGTPFAAYRKRIYDQYCKRHNVHFIIPNYYDWRLLEPDQESPAIDVRLGCDQTTQNCLKPGQLLHVLLQVLATDFYRPFRLGSLFSQLFPDERFDAINSKDRVSQLIFRLRNWFKKNNIPLHIREERNAYYLYAKKPFTLHITDTNKVVRGNQGHIEKLFAWKQRTPFSAMEAAKYLGVSKRLAIYVLQNELGGSLEKIGRGPSTRYQFLNHLTPKINVAG